MMYAQHPGISPRHLFRIYEDNDFLNISGNGTDNSYTNGLSLDFFYTNKKPSRSFIDRLMPRAGKNSVNVFGWCLTQLMFTPNDISTARYQPDDYLYSGVLFTTHSLNSINVVKKYSLKTEIIGGIHGPASFAREMQTFVHSVIHYTKPMGWNNQLDTYPLLNVNFIAEKQIMAIGQFIEIIAGAQLAVGSYMDAVHMYPLIRIGQMAPYFDGYFSRYGSFYKKIRRVKTQFYFIVKPENTIVFHNALVSGKRMNEEPGTFPKKESMRRIKQQLTDIQFGAVAAHGNFSLSYLQTNSTCFNEGLYHHNWGNLSLFYQW